MRNYSVSQNISAKYFLMKKFRDSEAGRQCTTAANGPALPGDGKGTPVCSLQLLFEHVLLKLGTNGSALPVLPGLITGQLKTAD